MIKQQDDGNYSVIDKIYLYIKDPSGAKYQYLLKKCEKNDTENLKNSKALIDYLNNMQDANKNIEEYNPDRQCNLLTVFDDMIADMISSNKLNQILTELFIRGRKLNISTVFIAQSYFSVTKDV